MGSNIHNRLALRWQTLIKQSGDGVLGCPSLLLSGQRQASAMHQSIPKVSRVYHIEVRLLKCFQCNTPLIARYSIWSFSQASTGGWGIRLPLPTIEWTEASLFYASVCLVVCHIGDRISESFLIHYNRHCLLLYLVSLPSVDRRLGNYPDFEKVASASRLS